VTLHSSECPVDLEEVAEAYVRGTLPKEQAIAFEDHYAICETCATVLYKTVDYVDAMRAAAKTLRSEPRNDLKMVSRSGNS
jgi:anti-sigma factor RsiW